MTVTVAIDAMGGDRAPGAIVDGAVQAASQLGARVLLVGRDDAIATLVPPGTRNVEIVAASEVVEMSEPATAVRAKKDASIVRCARLVRDGEADAMISAGNTGATMAAALLRIGRIRSVARPAIATPIPVPGQPSQVLVDSGATVDCAPEWLAQFARMGREYARARLGVDEPRIGLLSNGEEAGKGDELRKKTYALLEGIPGFVGNVEGRDFMRPGVDVIVTDGFTGNVALEEHRRRDPRNREPRVRRARASRAEGGERRGDAAPPRGGEEHRPRLRRWRDPPRRGGNRRRRARLVERARDRERRAPGHQVRRRADRRAHRGGGAECRLKPTWSRTRSDPTRCCA